MSTAAEWIVVCAIGCLLGWLLAHGTVATECERIGAFYVNNTTFECSVKERKP